MFGIETIKNMYLKHFVKKQLNRYYEAKGLSRKQIENLTMKEMKEGMQLLSTSINDKIMDTNYIKMITDENKSLKKEIEGIRKSNTLVAADIGNAKIKEHSKGIDYKKLMETYKEENKSLRSENAALETRNKALIETFARREDIKDLTKTIKKDLTRQQLIVSKTLGVENDLKVLKESVKGRQLEKAKV